MIINLGTWTSYGKVVAVGWAGERYYWCINKHGVVSMIPALVLEDDLFLKEEN